MGYEVREFTILKRVNEKSIRVSCRCGADYTQPFGDFVPQYMEEFKQYQNFNAECPECREVTVFNLNIPETRAQDIDQEPFMPPHEKEQRETLRELLWKLRPDLDESKREQTEKEKAREMEEIYGTDLETIKAMFSREISMITE